LTTRIATVGGRPIPVARLEARIAALRHGPRGRHLPPGAVDDGAGSWRWIALELVNEEVLAHEARAMGIVPDGAGSLDEADVARLVTHVTGDVAIVDEDVRAYYCRNADRYRRPEARRVRHVVLADEAEARSVAARVVGGEDLAALAVALSRDAGSRARGGDLGPVHRGELAGALEDALFAADAGQVVGPIRTEHGWHIARVESVEPESLIPFDEVGPAIETELFEAAHLRAFDDWLARRRAALAVMEPGFEHPGHPSNGLPSHRH
jgi:[acyl-carrier-protein] S-malonyltransferase